MKKYTSKNNFLLNGSVDRRILINYVSKKIKKSLPLYHISAVIGLLFEELLSELISKKEIVIGKFGKFMIKKLGPRRHHNVALKQIVVSEGNEMLRFQFHKDIQKILTNNLDIAKTFQETNDGKNG